MATERQSLLIVDDNPTNLKVAVSHLQAYSYEILTARDGQAGLKRARLAQPDLVLLDVEMPGIDGYETCRRLKADPDTAQIPVIFMTVRSQTEDKVRGFEAGAVDYVTKPIEASELLARVRTHLQLRALQRQLEASNESLEARVAERTAELERQLDQGVANQREREHLIATLSSQSEQLRRLTRSWLQDQADRDRGLSRTLKERVAERLGMTHVHLTQARELLRGDDGADVDVAAVSEHVVHALELLSPAVEDTEVVRTRLEEACDLSDNPLERLSARELEVLRMMVDGRPNKEIAFALDVARTTVSTYRTRILEKLGVEDLPSLVRLVVQFDRRS